VVAVVCGKEVAQPETGGVTRCAQKTGMYTHVVVVVVGGGGRTQQPAGPPQS
jgi:hypothetical protein